LVEKFPTILEKLPQVLRGGFFLTLTVCRVSCWTWQYFLLDSTGQDFIEIGHRMLFLCLCHTWCSGRIVFIEYVCDCVCAVHVCVPNIIKSVSCKLLYKFLPNLQHWCTETDI